MATENTRILVDAGLSMRELRKRLASIGESLDSIDAILITHEHSDHVSGLAVLARNKGVRAVIYMTRLTAPAIDWGVTPPARLEPFQAGSCFRIGDIEVQSFGIPHDAIDPVGYCFEAQGVRIGVATTWVTCRSPSSFICDAPTCCYWKPITIWTCSKWGPIPGA
jgi:phosphoribosyl 1,2-cyclic phosphodiesterase